MKNYFSIEKITKNGQMFVRPAINGLSIKDAEIIGREMGLKNGDILNGKIENKNDTQFFQFIMSFASAFFIASMFNAPKDIKEKTQHLFNESLFKVEEKTTEEENKTE